MQRELPTRMPAGWAALKDRLAGVLLSLRHRSALEQFACGADAAQNSVDIFKGEWISAFPAHVNVKAGDNPLYNDGRLQWLTTQTPVAGRRVLELGPLEGSHTFQLLQAAAASVTAIESNRRSFLKCLVTKELLGMDNARFLCADFMDYLECNPGERYDLCVASGVLYHMRDPLRMLGLCCQHADELFLWTHYYDEALLNANPAQAYRFGQTVACEWQGFKVRGYRRAYGAQIWNPLHLGSDAAYSVWLPRDIILDALRHFGFNDIVIGDEEPGHAAGPAFSLLARRG